MRIYLSVPMTGLPEHNFPAFREARQELRAEGFTVLCPAEAGVVEGWSWSQYLRRDLVMVCHADAVVVLHGWADSRGACLEVHVAQELGLPIRDFRDHHDLWEATS